jgi:hypothetical protein
MLLGNATTRHRRRAISHVPLPHCDMCAVLHPAQGGCAIHQGAQACPAPSPRLLSPPNPQLEHGVTCPSPWKESSAWATSPSSHLGPLLPVQLPPRQMEAQLPIVMLRRSPSTGGRKRDAFALAVETYGRLGKPLMEPIMTQQPAPPPSMATAPSPTRSSSQACFGSCPPACAGVTRY